MPAMNVVTANSKRSDGVPEAISRAWRFMLGKVSGSAANLACRCSGQRENSAPCLSLREASRQKALT